MKRLFDLVLSSIAFALCLPIPAGAAVVFVRVVPPRPVVERVVRAPGPGYVWVGGYYRWDGHTYIWTPVRLASGRFGSRLVGNMCRPGAPTFS